jgi:uncharacterized protein YndB with AHSA1/START domain
MARTATERTFDVSAEFQATPRAIVDAFFDPAALTRWWGASRSVTMPRLLGAFAVEWTPSDDVDPLLGRLGGGLHGTVMQYEPTRGFFIANMFWLPPDGDPLGPMALDVACAMCLTSDGRPSTRLTILQTGFDEGPRWRRYYERLQEGWPRSLDALRTLVEA